MNRLAALGVSSVFYLVVLGASWTLWGAPVRVHVVDATALLIAFWIPAQFITDPQAFLRRWPLVLCCSLAGTFLWDILATLVMVKRELFMGAILLYPGAIAAFGTLLLVSSAVTSALRRGLTNE